MFSASLAVAIIGVLAISVVGLRGSGRVTLDSFVSLVSSCCMASTRSLLLLSDSSSSAVSMSISTDSLRLSFSS